MASILAISILICALVGGVPCSTANSVLVSPDSSVVTGVPPTDREVLARSEAARRGLTGGVLSGTPAPPLVVPSNARWLDLSADMRFWLGVASITAGTMADSTGVAGGSVSASLGFGCFFCSAL